jgi:HEPN domain-containing protein
MYEQLCFHAQQAAEKSLKAVLLKLDVDFPPTHNLQFLVDLLPQNILRNLTLMTAPRLTVYATTFRYPGVSSPVSKKEYLEVINIAEAVVEWAEHQIAS